MSMRPHPGARLWLYLVILALLALAAMNRGDNLLFWIFGVMVALLFISAVGAAMAVRRLAVRRVVAENAGVGEPLVVRYEVTNRRALLPAFSVHFDERIDLGADWQALMDVAPAWVMHVGPGDTVHGESIFWPTRRGAAHFHGLRLRTAFPFGLVPISRTLRQPHTALVYPRLYRLRPRVLDSIAPSGPMGMRVTQHAGAGDDFYGLREFRDGDSLRHVCWKRLASRDELVSIERANPSPPRFRVVLNLTVTPADLATQYPAHDPHEREERAVSLAASIAHAADHDGYEVGLAVVGLEGERIEIRRGARHRRRLMARLAELDLTQPRRAPPAAGRDHEDEHAGIVVIHPGRIDPSIVAGDAWHFSVDQMDHLVEESIGWWEAERSGGDRERPEVAA